MQQIWVVPFILTRFMYQFPWTGCWSCILPIKQSKIHVTRKKYFVYNLIIEIKKIDEIITKSAWIAKYLGTRISKISETEVNDSYENTIIIEIIYDDK